MQTLLAEQPLVLSLMLGVLSAGLIYGWLQTGKTKIAVAGLLFAALIPLAWVVADRWETEREQIETLIYETAAAIQNNDHQRALDLIADPITKDLARRELASFVFDEARVTQIREIAVFEELFPPEAEVDINVKVIVSQKRGGLRNQVVPRRLILRLQKTDDSWLIIEYQHLPIIGGPDQYSRRQDLR